ncbi:MAG: hypothetical protein U1G07_04145 [Verrucomicrobiota bacterium]
MTLLEVACTRLKLRVDPPRRQMFDLYALKGWSAREAARAGGVNIGRVYLAKHRIGRMLKKEMAQCQSRLPQEL